MTGAQRSAKRLRAKIQTAPMQVQRILLGVEKDVLARAILMSSGPLSNAYLRSPLGYPYSRKSPGGDPLGDGDYAMVNYAGGEGRGPHIKDSWGVSFRKKVGGLDMVVLVTNSSPHMRLLMNSPRMVDRPLAKEVRMYARRRFGQARPLLREVVNKV